MKKIEKLNKKIQTLKLAKLSNEKSIRLTAIIEKSFSALVLKNLRHIKNAKLEMNNMMKADKDVRIYLNAYLTIIANKKNNKKNVELLEKIDNLGILPKYKALKDKVEDSENLIKEYLTKPSVIKFNNKLRLIKKKRNKNQVLSANIANCQNKLKELRAINKKTDNAINKLSDKLERLQ